MCLVINLRRERWIVASAHLLVLAGFSDFSVATTAYFAQTAVRIKILLAFSKVLLEVMKTVAPGLNPIYSYTKTLSSLDRGLGASIHMK